MVSELVNVLFVLIDHGDRVLVVFLQILHRAGNSTAGKPRHCGDRV